MYKAYIEPDLKTAHLKIYNTFNPFSGFMDPTYILKSAQRVSKETIHSLLKVTFIPDAANFRFCKFVLCQSAIGARLVGLFSRQKALARALIVQRKVTYQMYALQSWHSVQCAPPSVQCPPRCVQCPPLSKKRLPSSVQYAPPAAHTLLTKFNPRLLWIFVLPCTDRTRQNGNLQNT